MEKRPEVPASNSNTNKLLLILLILSLGANIWQWTSKTSLVENYDMKVDSLITARVDVEKELTDTYTELNQYKGINTRLDSLLQEANGKVEEHKSRIEKLLRNEKNSASLNNKLKEELAGLRRMRDEYLEKIDSLLVENNQLKKDKSDLTATVETLSKNLETTVSTASIIKAEYVKVTSYRKRSNNRYTSTALAKRTNKLETCFTLLENRIAKPGTKTIYYRIIEPGGKVLGNRTEGSSTFRKADSNEDLLYSNSKTVEYNNERQDVCLSWEEQDRVFASGTYMVEVYVDGHLAGVNSVNLR